MSRPLVELSECTLCGICADLCPEIFRLNSSGYVEVVEMEVYPEEDVQEAIKNCPVDCITREGD